MKVALLGLEFENSNMGCQALSYSFTHLFSEAAHNLNTEVQYFAIVFEKLKEDIQSKTGGSVEGIRINYKSISFWKQIRKLFKECDLIVDFTGGDSFSDSDSSGNDCFLSSRRAGSDDRSRGGHAVLSAFLV